MSTDTPAGLIEALTVQHRYVEAQLLAVQETTARLQQERTAILTLLTRYQAAAPGVQATDAPWNAGPAASEAAGPAPAPATLADQIAAILVARGPLTGAALWRTLQATYGTHLPSSTLHDHLARGLTQGTYSKTKYTWRLATQPAPEATP